MSKILLRVNIEKIWVKSNGDLPKKENADEDDKKAQKNNAIVATMVYPRSGAPNVISTKMVDLQNNKVKSFNLEDFWDSGLFKEEVDGETILRIQVTDRDEISKFDKVFTTIFSALMGAGLGAVTGGISNVFLGAIANLGIETYTGTISVGKGEKINVIGETGEIKLNTNEIEENLTLKLTAPKTIKKKVLVFEGSKIVRKEKTLVKAEQPNGEILLKLSSTPI